MQDIRARIERKLANSSSTPMNNDSSASLAQQTRRKLQKMFSEYEDNESFVSNPTPIELTKYNNKFQDLDYLTQARTKINDLQSANERLNMKLLDSDKHILAMKEKLDEERLKSGEREQKIIEKYAKEKEEIKEELNGKLEKNLKYIDELLEEKKQFNVQTEGFINEKRKLEKALMEQKEKTRIEVKSKLDAFEASEKEKRIKWEENKKNEIKENTIKGMEPELNSIITRTRNEIKAVEQRCQREKEEHRNQCYKDFERKVTEFKEEAFREHETEKEKLRVEYSTKLKEQYDKLESQFAADREKMRQVYKVEIEQQKVRRKTQQQDFMRKRRQLDSQHMEQIKKIRDDYQQRIRFLEGGRDVYLQSQKQRLQTKFKTTLDQQIQRIKRQQKEKFKTVYMKLEQKFQSQKQQYINSIAVMNSQLERDLQIKFQSKRKDERRLFEDQIKKSKRDIAVLQQKLHKQNKTSGDVVKQKDQFESKYLEIKVQYDELYQIDKENKLKIKEVQKQLDGLKGEMKEEMERKIEAERVVKEKELGVLRKIIEKQEEDRILLGKSGDSKVKESEKRWAEQMLELEKRARKVLDKKEAEIEALRKDIRKKEETAKEYQGMLEKQRQQLMASLYK